MRTNNTHNHYYVLIALYMSRIFTFQKGILLSSVSVSIDTCDDLWMNGLIEWHFMPYDSDPIIWITPKGVRFIESQLLAQAAEFSITKTVRDISPTATMDIEYIYREALLVIASNTMLNGIQCKGIAEYALREIDKVRGAA